MTRQISLTKICSKCGIEQPLDNFYLHPHGKDGHLNQCKECKRAYYRSPRVRLHKRLTYHAGPRKEYNLKYQQSEIGKAHRKETNKRYNQSEKRKLSLARYNHSEKRRAAEFRYDHSDYGKQSHSKWRNSKHGKVIRSGYEARRRSKIQIVNDFTPDDWDSLLKAYNYGCAYCGRSDVPMTQDHVIPLAKGGHHTKSNIVPACKSCNSRKRDKIIKPSQSYTAK